MAEHENIPLAAPEKIHEFAIKYHQLYSSPKTEERDVESTFAEECFALGFKMDCGESFQKEYHVNLNEKSNPPAMLGRMK